jgi:hypothetical protein
MARRLPMALLPLWRVEYLGISMHNVHCLLSDPNPHANLISESVVVVFERDSGWLINLIP